MSYNGAQTTGHLRRQVAQELPFKAMVRLWQRNGFEGEALERKALEWRENEPDCILEDFAVLDLLHDVLAEQEDRAARIKRNCQGVYQRKIF